MANKRSWTWIDEDMDDDTYPVAVAHEPEIEALMERWNDLQAEMEDEHFACLRRYDDGDEYVPEDEDEQRAIDARRRVHDDLQREQIAYLERWLADLGARPMRPYEHWNEDEARVQWEETRYDSEY